MNSSELQEKNFNILMVDDNPIDIILMSSAFRNEGNSVNFISKDSGSDGLEFIRQNIAHLDLIILDVNLNDLSGFDILRSIRQGGHIPVIMFSTSDLESDVKTAYDLGANSYLVKPLDHDQYERISQGICSFWFNANIKKHGSIPGTTYQ